MRVFLAEFKAKSVYEGIVREYLQLINRGKKIRRGKKTWGSWF